MNQLFFAEQSQALDLADDRADVPDGFHNVSRAGLAFRSNHGGAFGDAAQRFSQVSRAANKGSFEAVLPDVVLVVSRGEHFALVDVVEFERFQHLGFGKMPDANFGHHRNRHCIHDLANDARSSHARDAAVFADVGGHSFEGHHCASSRLLGNFCLLGVGDVHDHAAFQHFGQAYFDAPQIVIHQVHGVSPILRSDYEVFLSLTTFALSLTRDSLGSITTKRPRPRARRSPD